jgi:hypothetical protein
LNDNFDLNEWLDQKLMDEDESMDGLPMIDLLSLTGGRNDAD